MTTPLLVTTVADLDAALRGAAGRLALVPTMGALHEGHASLFRAARGQVGADGRVVVSIFVNPLQFGPTEDLDRYPRPLEADLKLAEREGVDVVFAPTVAAIYPTGVPTGPEAAAVTVDPGPLADVLEGRTRPGHFRGVLTVVAKLFGLVRPDVAVFGEKDYQQLALVRRLVEDLCLRVEVVGAPTQREPDGLAQSSRNIFLDDLARRQALALSRALRAAQEAAAYGHQAALAAAHGVLDDADGVEVDYLVVTGADLGAPPETGPGRVLVAARVGGTRLIDNLPLQLHAHL